MIFVDRLSLTTCFLVFRLLRKNKKNRRTVQVLDPMKSTVLSWLIKYWMQLFSVEVNEARFDVGNLYTKDGKSVWFEAKNLLTEISYRAAKNVISNSKALSNLTGQWNSNSVFLYLHKYLYSYAGYSGHRTVFKILIADALSQELSDNSNHLILGLPLGYTSDTLEGISRTIDVSYYSIRNWSIKSFRLSVFLLIIFFVFKKIKYQVLSKFKEKSRFGEISKPALLLLQEDDLSLDRSYRGQPHWLFTSDETPKFRTLILDYKTKSSNRDLNDYNIYSVPTNSLYPYSENHLIHKKITKSIGVILYQSIFHSSIPINILFELTLFYIRAFLLSNFCINQNIKVFMTCENYYRDADVMSMIGSDLGISSISYQYSNMDNISPLMLSASDTMCAFSPLFHDRWMKNNFQNDNFVYIGYLYDSSFKLLSIRAKEMQNKVKSKGVKFIITFFDENISSVQKYGFSNKDDCYQDISLLMKMMIDDETIAVVIKSQFMRNSPSILYEGDGGILEAVQTGRWIELQHGNDRNNIFPAEAAFLSDFVIGHVEGATAGLEAALTGCRCILLNTHRMEGANIKIFEQANILYSDMESALSAISSYRQGSLEYQNLGDWSSILGLFDTHQDGRSATRLRNFIESKLLSS